MKKLTKTAVVLLIAIPLLFSCESLTGELEDVSLIGPEIATQESNGTEGGGDVLPGEEPE